MGFRGWRGFGVGCLNWDLWDYRIYRIVYCEDEKI
jgi:hypothetical protein